MKAITSLLDSTPAPEEFEPRRVLVTGVDADEGVYETLRKIGFDVVDADGSPEFVISYGGDGSLLGADREYPKLPKLPIRRDREYDKCPRHGDEEILRRVFAGRISISALPRLEATAGGRTFHAINDVVFHNCNVTSAVRYIVRVDGSPCGAEIVGDGLVVATPFGSSAYYRSITNSVFRVGLGLAFNNSTESVNHMVLHPTSKIEVEVTRGPAVVVGDNMVEPASMDRGDILKVKLSEDSAEIWELENLFCMNCFNRRTRNPAGFRHV